MNLLHAGREQALAGHPLQVQRRSRRAEALVELRTDLVAAAARTGSDRRADGPCVPEGGDPGFEHAAVQAAPARVHHGDAPRGHERDGQAVGRQDQRGEARGRDGDAVGLLLGDAAGLAVEHPRPVDLAGLRQGVDAEAHRHGEALVVPGDRAGVVIRPAPEVQRGAGALRDAPAARAEQRAAARQVDDQVLAHPRKRRRDGHATSSSTSARCSRWPISK
jgi:hypothetical protein